MNAVFCFYSHYLDMVRAFVCLSHSRSGSTRVHFPRRFFSYLLRSMLFSHLLPNSGPRTTPLSFGVPFILRWLAGLITIARR